MCEGAGARQPPRPLCTSFPDCPHSLPVPVPRWHHAQCFFSRFPEVTLASLGGVDGLAEEDRAVLQQFCGGGDQAAPSAAPASEGAGKGTSTPSAKRPRGSRKGRSQSATAAPAPASATSALDDQNREYWAMRDALSAKVPRDWVTEVLAENGYRTSGGWDRCGSRGPALLGGAALTSHLAWGAGWSSAARMACCLAP